ncbi:hypothetical protein [Georgfuchsia toluolica]|nr:hypothetical protein [Georgfuchsia toluolica]
MSEPSAFTRCGGKTIGILGAHPDGGKIGTGTICRLGACGNQV